MTRKSSKHSMRHTEHRTAVLTLLGLISSAYHDLHYWRSNSATTECRAKTLPLSHQFTSHASNAKLTSHGKCVTT